MDASAVVNTVVLLSVASLLNRTWCRTAGRYSTRDKFGQLHMKFNKHGSALHVRTRSDIIRHSLRRGVSRTVYHIIHTYLSSIPRLLRLTVHPGHCLRTALISSTAPNTIASLCISLSAQLRLRFMFCLTAVCDRWSLLITAAPTQEYHVTSYCQGVGSCLAMVE